MTELPPWSYTMIESFEQCPRKAYHRFILKEKEPPSAAMQEGIDAHSALENRIKSNAPLIGRYAEYEPLAASVAAMRGGKKIYTELKMGITRKFTATGFFAKDVWGRGAVDFMIKGDEAAFVGDWKTGKINEKELQLKMFALFIFEHFPQVNKVTAVNLWLKEKSVGKPYVFLREHKAVYWADVLPRIERMERAASKDEWQPQPSPLCAWCPVKSCQHNLS